MAFRILFNPLIMKLNNREHAGTVHPRAGGEHAFIAGVGVLSSGSSPRGRGTHGDSPMAVLGVVPREERPAEGDGGVDIVESPGEAGVVLQGLELGLGEGVVIADLGAAQRASDPEVGEQLRGAFAGHGRPAVGVQGEDLGLDALFVAGLLDETTGQR